MTRFGITVEVQTVRSVIVVTLGASEGIFVDTFITADQGKLLTADAAEYLVIV